MADRIDPDSLLFQKHAEEADRVVSMTIAACLEQGIDSAALCAGALFAVVRLHLGFEPIRAAQPLFDTMWPALRKTCDEVARLDAEAPRLQVEGPRKLDS